MIGKMKQEQSEAMAGKKDKRIFQSLQLHAQQLRDLSETMGYTQEEQNESHEAMMKNLIHADAVIRYAGWETSLQEFLLITDVEFLYEAK